MRPSSCFSRPSQPCCLTSVAGNAQRARILISCFSHEQAYGAIDLTCASPVITLPCIFSVIGMKDEFASCADVLPVPCSVQELAHGARMA